MRWADVTSRRIRGQRIRHPLNFIRSVVTGVGSAHDRSQRDQVVLHEDADVLVDLETGKPLELELLRHMPDEEYDRVRLRAVDVPALGYRCYGVVPRGSIPERAKDEAPSNTIESRYYRVTVDPERGGIGLRVRV